MVIIDRKTMESFQKPYKPTPNSKSIVITIPKEFAVALDIDWTTQLKLSLDKRRKNITIEKVKGDDF